MYSIKVTTNINGSDYEFGFSHEDSVVFFQEYNEFINFVDGGGNQSDIKQLKMFWVREDDAPMCPKHNKILHASKYHDNQYFCPQKDPYGENGHCDYITYKR